MLVGIFEFVGFEGFFLVLWGFFFGFAAKLNVWFQEVYVPSQNNLDTFVLPYLLSSWNEFCV